MFIETSAKAGFNIKALFRKVASALPGIDSNDVERNTPDPVKVEIPNPPPQSQGWCGNC